MKYIVSTQSIYSNYLNYDDYCASRRLLLSGHPLPIQPTAANINCHSSTLYQSISLYNSIIRVVTLCRF